MEDMYYQLVAVHNNYLSDITRRIGKNSYQLIKPQYPLDFWGIDDTWTDNPRLYTRPSCRVDSGTYSLFLFGFQKGAGAVMPYTNEKNKLLVSVSNHPTIDYRSLVDLDVFDESFISYVLERQINIQDLPSSKILKVTETASYRNLRLV